VSKENCDFVVVINLASYCSGLQNGKTGSVPCSWLGYGESLLLLVTLMKFKRLALVTVTVMVMGVLLPSAAHAVQWVKVAVAEDGMNFYLDTDSQTTG